MSAANQLRAYLDRIERLQEERKSIADDIAEVFKELTSDGYDKDAAKVVLKIRASADGITNYNQHSGMVGTYLVALGMVPDRAPAHAHVENIEQFAAGHSSPQAADRPAPLSLPPVPATPIRGAA